MFAVGLDEAHRLGELCYWVAAAAAVPLQFSMCFIGGSVYLAAIKCKYCYQSSVY